MSYKSPEIHRTPVYRAKAAYRNMLRRCSGGNAIEKSYSKVRVKMTMKQWMSWAVPKYESFLANRIGEIPCVSRNGDKGHYEIGNIELISTVENRSAMKEILSVDSNGMKLCCTCRVKKNREMFSKNRSRKDGLHSDCKECAYKIIKACRKKLLQNYKKSNILKK